MSPVKKKDPYKQWLVIMTWTPCNPTERWCSYCHKSSLRNAPVFLLDTIGVGFWGTVIKCFECKYVKWIDKDNVVRNVKEPEEKA